MIDLHDVDSIYVLKINFNALLVFLFIRYKKNRTETVAVLF